MARFIDGNRFENIVKRHVCGTAVHAERRIHEVSEAMALLKALDAPTRMTKSTRESLRSIVDMGLRERFGGREPDTVGAVLDALIELRSAGAK
jgi:hypothetical protein